MPVGAAAGGHDSARPHAVRAAGAGDVEGGGGMTPTAVYWDRWPIRAAPYLHGGESYRGVLVSWISAAVIAATGGMLFFGAGALVVLLISTGTALGAELVLSLPRHRAVSGGMLHAALIGLLLGLTLPPTAPWYVPVIGSLVAIGLGKVLFGGIGHYLWHPALIGRVLVQFLFPQLLNFSDPAASGYVLTPAHLLWGDARNAAVVEPAEYQGWATSPQLHDADALALPRPVASLRRFADGQIPREGGLIFSPLIRDVLPPWEDTFFGTVPGGIGETSAIALIVGGLYLIHRGHLRWQFPLTTLASAGLAAAILPVLVEGPQGGYKWFPALAVEEGRAVGLQYVLYHLTSGQLMIAAFLLGGDMVLTPMRAKGQVLFAAGVGVFTIFMRLYGLVESEAYWAILGMNWVVPFIDRRMKRPVLGMGEAA